MPLRKVDHIVYAVPDLEKGIDHIHQLLGVRPTFGGYHTTQGTKNAILNLGDRIYLEILAVDESNKAISSDRWMGIDLIQSAKITRWAITSDDLGDDAAKLKAYHPDLSTQSGGQRKMTNGELLQWQMILPAPSPEVELMPFMINWSGTSTHPTASLPDVCKLKSIRFYHPNPNEIHPHFRQLSLTDKILLSRAPFIEVEIACPNGLVLLR